MSRQIENFSLPVCNSFEPVLHKDQLCYQVDLEKFRSKKNFKKQLVSGLDLILDYNEDKNMLKSATSAMDQGHISIETISIFEINAVYSYYTYMYIHIFIYMYMLIFSDEI